jgi:predicted DCC family thiol-disulfide oxidoreductase YuxK
MTAQIDRLNNSHAKTGQGNQRHELLKALHTKAWNPAIYPLTIYYESACPLCNAEMTNLMLRNTNQLLVFADVSAPGFNALPEGTTLQAMLELIHARRADGAVIKGVEVFRLAYEAVGMNRVASALRLPVLGWMADRSYPWVARNRHRFPRALIRLVFEGDVRRAAERAAEARCISATCARDESSTAQPTKIPESKS